VRTTTPIGRVNVRPYSWNVQNIVGANWIMPQWWVSGPAPPPAAPKPPAGDASAKKAPEASGKKPAGRRLQGWDWPNVRTTTPIGRVNVRPYSWNVQNIVGGNMVMPQWWVSGPAPPPAAPKPPAGEASAKKAPEASGKSGRKL
jgi:hypothetical protein